MLATIHSFLEMGIDPMRIVVVCGENVVSDLNRRSRFNQIKLIIYLFKISNLFNNPFVAGEIAKMLKRLNIEIFESYQMHEWNNGRWGAGKLVNKIRFKQINDSDNSDNHNNKKGPSSFELDCCVRICLKTLQISKLYLMESLFV